MRISRKHSYTNSTRSKALSHWNTGFGHIARLMLAMVMFSIFAISPAVAQDGPCSQCSPGEHWVDTCPGSQDQITNHNLVVGIDLDLDCEVDIELTLSDSPLIVDRSDPQDDSLNFPGLRPLDGHLDVIDTEIVSMSLIGSGGITVTAGGGLGQGGSLAPSLGTIAEQPADPERAYSFFDVFFEIDMGGGMYVYNQTASRIEAVIDCVPPRAIYVKPPQCLSLYTSPIPGEGEHIANLVTGEHSVNPPDHIPGMTLWGILAAVTALAALAMLMPAKKRAHRIR